MVMLKDAMVELRAVCGSDPRWLQHYGLSPLGVPMVSGG